MSALIDRECRAAELRRQDLLREAVRWRQYHEIPPPRRSRAGRLSWPRFGWLLARSHRAPAT